MNWVIIQDGTTTEMVGVPALGAKQTGGARATPTPPKSLAEVRLKAQVEAELIASRTNKRYSNRQPTKGQ